MNVKIDECAGPGLWSIETAFSAIVAGAAITACETVPLRHALGRVTARDVFTETALPRFDQSAMDGYGLHAEDIATHRTGPFKITGLVRAGGQGRAAIHAGETVRLLTGAAIPTGVAAVVMEERVGRTGDTVSLRVLPQLGQNIRRRGEDVATGATIISTGQRLDARHLAILAASGCTTVKVVRPVRVGLLSTGDELVDPGDPAGPQAVYDCNRPMIAALLASPAAAVEDLGRIEDDAARYAGLLAEAHADYDVIVSSGGVSGSDADHSVHAVEMAGGKSTRISLAMKPGKPIAYGSIGACRVIALPGNPVAAMVGTLLFARPLVKRLAGQDVVLPEGLRARTASAFYHRPGRTEFVPAAVTGRAVDGHLLVEKLGKGGSARLSPLVTADGLAVVHAVEGDVAPGEMVAFHPFKADFGL